MAPATRSAFGLALMALLALTAIAAASDVVDLNKDNFDSVVNAEGATSMVEFFAPWCGHCKQLAPKYEEAATKLKGIATIAKVDCTEQTELCQKHGIRGYPTLKVFRNKGDSVVDYSGAREVDALVSFMKKQVLPAVSTFEKADELTKFIEDDRVVVVGFFEEGDAKAANFKNVAEKLREKMSFASTTSADLAKAHGVTAPAVVLFKKFDEGKNILQGSDFSVDTVQKFVSDNSVALMEDLNQSNYQHFASSPLPMAVLFVTTDEHRATLGKGVEAIAKELKGKMNFVYLDATKYGAFAEALNLKQEFPAFAIQGQKGAKFPLSQDAAITAEAIGKLAKGMLDGSVTPTLKSEPIPEKQEGPITVVVGKTYDSIVNEKGKDVLVQFYAPWCGHCKNLIPIYDELAGDLKSNSNIVIAKMDATANDLPLDAGFEIHGFPTIKLVTADGKVVDFNGERTVEGFKKFIEANGTAPKPAAAAAAAEEEKKEEKKDEKKDEEKKDHHAHGDL
ncbi:hypothetical protein H696_02569 [Fonticula alba]|uniref:Protein disulfide-isomerase n=1 Tax=Fonticula alba TaxID=691883 RepID=A0A058Z7G2_FONAL|nr:hypothetical protein H696_02569 [Fonticula alba]KCV70239.1 hypothetical protein H696_02569 [Fonticula alba]|eukprot:XP_009494755.1 hypothetical protein H696_02569 [Fonticula alba]